MSSRLISVDYSPYSNLTECQFIGSPIHSSKYTPTNSAKELIFHFKISNALQDINIEDDDEELSESSEEDTKLTYL